eukprot:3505325-Prymnesium_polylepis.1
MPHEELERIPDRIRRDWRDMQVWRAGGLNAAEQMGHRHWPILRDALVRNIGFDSRRMHFIRGFYNESLRSPRTL